MRGSLCVADARTSRPPGGSVYGFGYAHLFGCGFNLVWDQDQDGDLDQNFDLDVGLDLEPELTLGRGGESRGDGRRSRGLVVVSPPGRTKIR